MEQITLRENFIQVSGNGLKASFGGSQEWFTDDGLKNIKAQGCGVISSVDTVLYLSGVSIISIDDYRCYIEQFLRETRFAKFFLREFQIRKYDNNPVAIGIIPIQMSRYLNKRMKIFDSQLRFRWNGFCGHKNMYFKIKEMLYKDFPVIWSLYSPKNQIKLYTRTTDGGFVFNGISTNNHYVTITGIIEDESQTRLHERMIEVSSWGKCYYIDYDEYLVYVGSSWTSRYCSNILILK
ncbi:hypothetical protein [Pseudobutyrivibrio xylanivorans]|uniref:Uncharacterized protein n=1 Tax=Pseudobutyrivibrio xylanivorans TaxID=185007 RepID=A0A5P6VMA5_PSEXY|nr:hypothetical protein [Pseudobutyrivibrio xylanivorans]QFJ53783.1 hypothetical protein FXF36_02310 [Pseudobutyrivibrio xylanivorans]